MTRVANPVEVARLRLRSLDFAVLASARIGALTITMRSSKRSSKIAKYYMGDINVGASINRLVRAHELLHVREGGSIRFIFPEEPEFKIWSQRDVVWRTRIF